MSNLVSRTVSGLALVSVLTLASVCMAGDAKVVSPAVPSGPVVSITRVTWGLTYPGGVGAFRVTVGSTGALRAGAVWAQAVSPGTPTLQAAVGGVAKPGAVGVAQIPGTGNGRCYDVVLAIEPDSASSGVRLDPKNSTRRVCLDPDGAGIYH